MTPVEIALHMSCGAVALVVAFGAFACGWVGGGDAKLFGAAALWLGWQQLTAFTAITALAGGVLAFAFIALRLMPAGMVLLIGRRVGSLAEPGIPYGMALAGAALVVYPHSAWISRILG